MQQSPPANKGAIYASVLTTILGILVFCIGAAAYSVSPKNGAGAWWAGLFTVISSILAIGGARSRHNQCARVTFIVCVTLTLIITGVSFLYDASIVSIVRTVDFCDRRASDLQGVSRNDCCDPGNEQSCFVNEQNPKPSHECICCYTESERDNKYTGYVFDGVDHCGDLRGKYARLLSATVALNVVNFLIMLIVGSCFCCCHLTNNTMGEVATPTAVPVFAYASSGAAVTTPREVITTTTTTESPTTTAQPI
eukprot:c1240_g1_i1.p1 GENE.c1240_g1_i1~~c1240_g1_i1.p1  ORF type:complete len:264 (-),score=61.94 c1240_g1_i1:38-793(-)